MDLAFLTPLADRPGPWASVYVDTSQTSPTAAGEQKLAAREACDRLSRDGADDPTCRAVYDMITSLPRSGEAPGQAVFATGGEIALGLPLATAPPGAQATWSALPHVGPLLEYTGEDPACLVAYIDRRGADFELRDEQGRHPAGRQRGADWPVHRTATADWSERHFQLKVENTWERNAEEIAKALYACWEETGAQTVLLVGDPRERRAVHERLPEPLRSAATETEHGGRAAGSGSRLLDHEIAQARAEHVREHTAEVLDRFREGRAHPGDGERRGAVEGVPALVEAAREHRIATLLVRPDGSDLRREVWVGREPDQVAMRRTDAQYLGDLHPVSARADDALLRSAAATGAEALRVPSAAGAADDLPVGGLGALLRWPRDGEAR